MTQTPDQFFDNPDHPRPLSKSQKRKARHAEKRVKESGLGGAALVAKSPSQKSYIDRLHRGESVFAVGPAGTGKTYIPARLAAAKLREGAISKIIISRVTVAPPRHALGFLPGKVGDKMAPWLVPVFDGIKAEVSGTTLEKWKIEGKLEVVPFEFMRGRTFKDCWVILDEAQNATMPDLKLLLTRIGEDCQVVVTGDLDQIDIRDSGLFEVIRIARAHDVPMAVAHFGTEDVVRSAFTKAWVAAFQAESGITSGNLDGLPAFLHNPPTVTKSAKDS